MELSGKKIAVLVDNVYQELEVWYPYLRLKEAGADVLLVGPQAGESYKSKLGYPAKAEQSYSEVKAEQFDAVVVPGGFAPDHIRRHPEAIEFVRQADQQGKVVAAICHGPWVLCSTGSLRGRRATGFFSIKDDMVNAGATFVDEEVCVDRNVVTSRKPEDLPAFCRAIISLLSR
jgi:protease I